MSDNNQNEQNEKAAQTPKRETQGRISGRRIRANRENAQKSTGPRSAQGKRTSSFNSLKHGLLARKLMFSPNGKLEDGLQNLFESLRGRFDCDDVVGELLVELLVTDYWRLQRGLQQEIKDLERGAAFHPQGDLPVLTRYLTANRRAFDRSLQTLMAMQEKPEYAKEQSEPNPEGLTDGNESDSAATPEPDEGAGSG